MDAALQPTRSGPLPAIVVWGGSLFVHAVGALFLLSLHPQPPEARQVPIEVVMIEHLPARPLPAPPPPPPVAAKRAPAARAPRRLVARMVPRPPSPELPPPPTHEAREISKAPPLIVSGITLASTASAGSLAVGAGNTLSGPPPAIAVAPGAAAPYKAGRSAPVGDVSEPPAVTLRADLKEFYPREAQANGFEGDVLLKLLIDGDGSLARIELLKDPGQGLGEAGLRAIRRFRFRAARLNGASVATTITFVLHFLLH